MVWNLLQLNYKELKAIPCDCWKLYLAPLHEQRVFLNIDPLL